MRIGCKGLKLLHGQEGCHLTAYRDTNGVPTIGWGTQGKLADGRPIVLGMTITKEEADAAFEAWLQRRAYPSINSKIKVPLTQNQFDALVDFAYNIGSVTNRLAAAVNSGNKQLIFDTFASYNTAIVKDKNTGVITHPVLKGLVKRRNAEIVLFFDETNDNCVLPSANYSSSSTSNSSTSNSATSSTNEDLQKPGVNLESVYQEINAFLLSGSSMVDLVKDKKEVVKTEEKKEEDTIVSVLDAKHTKDVLIVGTDSELKSKGNVSNYTDTGSK